MKAHLLYGVFCSFIILACHSSQPTTDGSIDDDKWLSYVEIPDSLYVENSKNKLADPANALIEALRDRKRKDLNNPDAPRPFSQEDRTLPKRLAGSQVDWGEIEDVLKFDWKTLRRLNPMGVEQLKNAVKTKVVLDHPDLKIIELVIGPGGVLPSHDQAPPSALHILSGSAFITIKDITAKIYVGSSIKLASYAKRRIQVTGDEPLRALWFHWAPNGRQEYLDYGYYLTGCNFHIQPLEAIMPHDFEIWKEVVRKRSEIVQSPYATTLSKNEFLISQHEYLVKYKSDKKVGLNAYLATPLLSSEIDVHWLDFTNIKGGFFWAKDAGSAADLLSSWNEIARMKGIFQAKVEDALYDFNLSYLALGPHGKYVTHSHATPEFYYILGGQTEWILEGERIDVNAGDVLFHSPYWDHEMQPLESGEPMRAITGSWAPFGDREVFEKPFLLLEELPLQKESASIEEGFNFYDFPLKEGLKFRGGL